MVGSGTCGFILLDKSQQNCISSPHRLYQVVKVEENGCEQTVQLPNVVFGLLEVKLKERLVDTLIVKLFKSAKDFYSQRVGTVEPSVLVSV